MLDHIKIENFRSVERAEVMLAPITVLFGPTGGGKSTLLYATLAFRNFVLNPNQAIDGLFNLGFLNLGGHEACVFNHDTTKEIGIEIRYRNDVGDGSYGLRLTKSGATLSLASPLVEMTANVAVPYALNQSLPFTIQEGEEEFTVAWNGISSTVAPKTPTVESQARAQQLAVALNSSSEALRRIDVVPHRRGFFKPSYSPSALSSTPTNEDEVASIIINDMNLAPRISACTEEIFGRDFRVHVAPGTAMAFFQTTEKKTRMPVHLVNDGFGVNQVVYILAKLQRPDVDTILIEEPEIHLHPTVISRMARVLCSIVKEDQKQIILATHSEQFVFALLTCVKESLVSASDLLCYHVTREHRKSVFQQQVVHENGQIEGGLSAFVEAETQDLRKFLAQKT